MYNCKYFTHTNKDMKNELRFLHKIFMNEKNYTMQTPIYDLIDRHIDYTTFDDACLEACGSSRQPHFWWFLDFLNVIKDLIFKHHTVINRDKLIEKKRFYKNPRVCYRDNSLLRPPRGSFSKPLHSQH